MATGLLFAAVLVLSSQLLAEPAAPETGADIPVRNLHMQPGYFRAGSAIVDRQALGGFAPSDNYPKRLDQPAPADAISLIALPEVTATFDGPFQGFRVVLANTTRKAVPFQAADSRLSIVREALDSEGNWKPIEYLPSSWCGNSYHRVFLPPDHYWLFAAPVYEGPFDTTMRFVLYVDHEAEPIYSNTFHGSIDPGQFSSDNNRGT
jgi:hypothetical protein